MKIDNGQWRTAILSGHKLNIACMTSYVSFGYIVSVFMYKFLALDPYLNMLLYEHQKTVMISIVRPKVLSEVWQECRDLIESVHHDLCRIEWCTANNAPYLVRIRRRPYLLEAEDISIVLIPFEKTDKILF